MNRDTVQRWSRPRMRRSGSRRPPRGRPPSPSVRSPISTSSTAVCRLYDEIWRPDPTTRRSPPELLRALTKAGNYVVGAFDGARAGGRLRRVLRPADRPRRCTATSPGVSAAAHGRSVGFALKSHQRAWAMRRGVATIAWTFDPLVRRNAYFNLAKLGATPVEYLPNFYGGMHDSINGDDDTDRLLVRWDLYAPAVAAACAGKAEPRDARGRAGARRGDRPRVLGRGRPGRRHVDGRTVLVAVPPDIESLRPTDPGLAKEWRVAVREALASLMAAGARVSGFDRAGWYVVTRTDGGGFVKLTGVELRRIEMPLVAPFRTSFGTETVRDVLLLRVVTGEAEGWGECVAMSDPLYSSEYVDAAQDVLTRFLIPALAAAPRLDASAGRARAGPVQGTPDGQGRAGDGGARRRAARRGPPARARARRRPRPCPLWSVGRHHGLDRSAARRRRRLPRRGLRADQAEDRAGLGHRAGTRGPRALRRRHRCCRSTPTPRTPWPTPGTWPGSTRSVCCSSSSHSTRRTCSATPSWPSTSTPRSASTSRSRPPAPPPTRSGSGACQIVNIKPGRVGGYLEARRIHDVCAAHGVPVWCGGMLETGIGRAANVALAALPGFTLPGDTSASDRYFRTDVTEPFVLDDGHLRVPTCPGPRRRAAAGRSWRRSPPRRAGCRCDARTIRQAGRLILSAATN